MSTSKNRNKSKNRRTLYLRPNKDVDIIEFVSPLLEHGDFSQIIRELVRDGIKFRQLGTSQNEDISLNSFDSRNVIQSNTFQNEAAPPKSFGYRNVIQSNTPKLERIELKRKELTDSELEDRLDGF